MPVGDAVIIGGSIAGLCTAGAIAEGFDRVRIVDRDALPVGPTPRKGSPQDRHTHVLLGRGLQEMEHIFPGLADDLRDAGALWYDQVGALPRYRSAGWRVRTPSDVFGFGVARPLLEHVLRQRVRRIPNVRFERGAVTGLTVDSDGEAITAVTVDGSVGSLDAAFTVDATGRSGASNRWLASLGFDVPRVVEMFVDVGYASVTMKLRDGSLPSDAAGLSAMPQPGNVRGGVVTPCGNGVHVVTAMGINGDYPPTDWVGFYEFLKSSASPLLASVARTATPLSRISGFRARGNTRRLWEELDRLPHRLAAVGDSVAAFNPIHGQGMTVAALSARVLAGTLRDLSGDLDLVGHTYHERVSPQVDLAFNMAVQADAVFPLSRYDGLLAPTSEALSQLQDLEELATVDPEVAVAVTRASFYMDPDALEGVRNCPPSRDGTSIERRFDPRTIPAQV